MDGAERFWRKWIKADSLEKGKVVEKLMKHVTKEQIKLDVLRIVRILN